MKKNNISKYDDIDLKPLVRIDKGIRTLSYTIMYLPYYGLGQSKSIGSINLSSYSILKDKMD